MYIAQLDKILNWKFRSKVVCVLVVLTLIGLIAEYIQTYLPARKASSDDLWRNLAGTTTGLIAYSLYRFRERLSLAIVLSGLLALSLIALWVCRPAFELAVYATLKTNPPTIISFDDPFVGSMISTTGGAKTTFDTLAGSANTPRKRTLRMDFAQQPYSGVILHEPEGLHAGSGVLALQLLNNDNQPRTLELRIHDSGHDNSYEDRFNTLFYVEPGENEVTIPVESIHSLGGQTNTRLMDMHNISELQLFSNAGESFTLYLRGIVLTQEK